MGTTLWDNYSYHSALMGNNPILLVMNIFFYEISYYLHPKFLGKFSLLKNVTDLIFLTEISRIGFYWCITSINQRNTLR